MTRPAKAHGGSADPAQRAALLIRGFNRLRRDQLSPVIDELFEIGRSAALRRDVALQRRLVGVIRRSAAVRGAGDVALALVGTSRATGADVPNLKRSAALPVLDELGDLVDRKDAAPQVTKAATFAVFLVDRSRAAARLRLALSPANITNEAAVSRAKTVLNASLTMDAPRNPEFATLLAQMMVRQKPPRQLPSKLFGYAFGALAKAGRERSLASVLRLDVADDTLTRLFSWLTHGREGRRADIATLKRILPPLREVAKELVASGDRDGMHRLKVVEKAMSAPGTLTTGAKADLVAPPRVQLKSVPRYAEGGPVMAMPLELTSAWEGCEPPSGGRKITVRERFTGPDGPATDYDRACNAGHVGVIDVGNGSALVLDEVCEWCALPDGSGAFVMEGNGEQVAAALGDAKWRRLPGRLRLSSGTLAAFDAVFTGKKAGGKRSLKAQLAKGTYQVDELRQGRRDAALWMVRLKRAGP